jgi:hypothetical protein
LTRLVPLFLLLLTGCTLRTEVGAGKAVAFSRVIAGDTGQLEDVCHCGIGLGGEVIQISEDLHVDTFAGPAVEDQGWGFDVLPRLRYSGWEALQPYFGLAAGFRYGVEDQATPWGFALGGGPGVRLMATKTSWLTLEYRVWHESNGSKVFRSPEPNPGFNSDLLILGMEIQF